MTKFSRSQEELKSQQLPYHLIDDIWEMTVGKRHILLMLTLFYTTLTWSEVITFADSNVKAICVANWDKNGDKELDEDELAAVSFLSPNLFNNNKQITSFDELKYFTGVTAIQSFTFEGCSNLVSITIPENVSSISSFAFYACI